MKEKCPICLGTSNKDGMEDNPFGTTVICPCCGGKRWVEVDDDYPEIYWPMATTEGRNGNM